jgi:hypothetical protein
MYTTYLVQTMRAEVVKLDRLVCEDEKLEDSEVNCSRMLGNQSRRKSMTHDDPRSFGEMGGEVE